MKPVVLYYRGQKLTIKRSDLVSRRKQTTHQQAVVKTIKAMSGGTTFDKVPKEMKRNNLPGLRSEDSFFGVVRSYFKYRDYSDHTDPMPAPEDTNVRYTEPALDQPDAKPITLAHREYLDEKDDTIVRCTANKIVSNYDELPQDVRTRLRNTKDATAIRPEFLDGVVGPLFYRTMELTAEHLWSVRLNPSIPLGIVLDWLETKELHYDLEGHFGATAMRGKNEQVVRIHLLLTVQVPPGGGGNAHRFPPRLTVQDEQELLGLMRHVYHEIYNDATEISEDEESIKFMVPDYLETYHTIYNHHRYAKPQDRKEAFDRNRELTALFFKLPRDVQDRLLRSI
jgi:hypothetical protein